MSDTSKRIWLDSIIANNLSIDQINKLIMTDGYTIVTSNIVIDMKPFQEHPDWMEYYLQHGRLIIEDWNMSTMCSEPFFWSSCYTITEPAASINEAITYLPNAEKIMYLVKLVSNYAIPNGHWPQGPCTPPEPISPEITKQLLLTSTDVSRSDIYVKAKGFNLMHLFDEYNRGYCRGIATQHHCIGIVNSDGTVTEF